MLDDDALGRLRNGVDVDGRIESFTDIRYYDGSGTNHWYHVVLMEGRNREVRDLFASQGATVNRLKRVRYGPVILPAWLPRGGMGRDGSRRCRAVAGHHRPGTGQTAPAETTVEVDADSVSQVGVGACLSRPALGVPMRAERNTGGAPFGRDSPAPAQSVRPPCRSCSRNRANSASAAR